MVELQGPHMKTAAARPPALTSGIVASSHIRAAHFSQLGASTGRTDIPNPSRRKTGELFKIAHREPFGRTIEAAGAELVYARKPP
jgi:hypothetical protein